MQLAVWFGFCMASALGRYRQVPPFTCDEYRHLFLRRVAFCPVAEISVVIHVVGQAPRTLAIG